MNRFKRVLSCFAMIVLILCLVAATSSVAVAQRAAIGFPFGSNLQAPVYGATAKSDVCLAVFLLDTTGRISFVRYGFLASLYTTSVSTGKYIPVFVAYAPDPGPVDYVISRCAKQPTLATLITDPKLEPKLWLSLAPSQNPRASIYVDQGNATGIGAIVAVAGGGLFQNIDITQLNSSSINMAVGFGGVAPVPFEDMPNIPKLLNWLTSCGTPYPAANGYGLTCNPSQQP